MSVPPAGALAIDIETGYWCTIGARLTATTMLVVWHGSNGQPVAYPLSRLRPPTEDDTKGTDA